MNIAFKNRHNRLYQDTLKSYQFRVGTPADVEGIIALWPEHWAEVHYRDRNIIPDEGRYRKWLSKVLEYGLEMFLVALYEGKLIGFFSYSMDHNFSVRPVAVMDKFFVCKAHRRTAVAAVLFDLALRLAKEEDACAFHAPITSETLASRALENMFRNHGFVVLGAVMGRTL